MAYFPRVTTQGCSELSCMYHGDENAFKRAHAKSCPIRGYDGLVLDALEWKVEEWRALGRPVCDCGPVEFANGEGPGAVG